MLPLPVSSSSPSASSSIFLHWHMHRDHHLKQKWVFKQHVFNFKSLLCNEIPFKLWISKLLADLMNKEQWTTAGRDDWDLVKYQRFIGLLTVHPCLLVEHECICALTAWLVSPGDLFKLLQLLATVLLVAGPLALLTGTDTLLDDFHNLLVHLATNQNIQFRDVAEWNQDMMNTEGQGWV